MNSLAVLPPDVRRRVLDRDIVRRENKRREGTDLPQIKIPLASDYKRLAPDSQK